MTFDWSLSLDTVVVIVGYVVSIICFAQRIDRRLTVLEVRQEEILETIHDYPKLSTRVSCVEASARSAHHRIDAITGMTTHEPA